MNLIEKIKNKYVSPLLAFITIFFIGYLDYISGEELSFSFFYLLPISALAISSERRLISIIFISILAALVWFTVDNFAKEYSSLFYPVWNAAVRLFFFLTIGLSIYSLKEKENKLQVINSKLKSMNDEKNKFIGIASHDIRGPLGIINSFSTILLEDYKEELNTEIKEILDIIKKTSSNSITILSNLLDVSKIESGKLILTYKSQDYISFIKSQVYLNQLLAKNKDIEISVETDKDQLVVDFDEHYFSEVIGNLLSNAIKYSKRNSQILVKVSLLNENELLTEVIDNGIGISESEQKNLFYYFQKTSSRPTEGEDSTGLGLAISKQIINLHQGKIDVKSTINQGSNFFFQIPLKNL